MTSADAAGMSIDERITSFRYLVPITVRRVLGITTRHRDWDEANGTALESLWLAAKGWDSDRGVQFRSYAIQAIRNNLVKWAVKWSRHGFTYWPTDRTPFSESFTAYEERAGSASYHEENDKPHRIDTERVRVLMNQLPPRVREVLRRRFWEKQSRSFIAEDAGLCVERIRQLEVQGLNRIRELVEGPKPTLCLLCGKLIERGVRKRQRRTYCGKPCRWDLDTARRKALFG